jgi:6,7-dimethyl-8-ribityllumazine synthase
MPRVLVVSNEPAKMTSKKKNLSEHQLSPVHAAGDLTIGVLVSEWNKEITGSLRDGAIETLVDYGIKRNHISVYEVPGSFELPLAARFLCEAGAVDAVICIGCIIQGETRHFEFICQTVAGGISRVGLDHSIPVIFGVLTTNTYEQAMERAGGRHGNKGVEAAVAALKMLTLIRKIDKDTRTD